MDKKINSYIAKQKSPQKEILQKLRKIILGAIPGINEEFKLGVPWYEGKYYIVGLRDHVNLGFLVNGLSRKEQDLFEGSGKMMRHIKFFALQEIDEKRIARLLKLVDKKSISCSH